MVDLSLGITIKRFNRLLGALWLSGLLINAGAVFALKGDLPPLQQVIAEEEINNTSKAQVPLNKDAMDSGNTEPSLEPVSLLKSQQSNTFPAVLTPLSELENTPSTTETTMEAIKPLLEIEKATEPDETTEHLRDKTALEESENTLILVPLATIETDSDLNNETMAIDSEMGEAEKISELTVTTSKKEENQKPVYSPLEAVAVFPVLHHGSDKAYGDVAILFANALADRLSKKYPGTKVYNPVYSVERLRMKGLDRLYNRMIDYYIRAGEPEPRALSFILSSLSNGGPEIARAIFIEADVDLHHQNRSFRPSDIIRKFHSDSLPTEKRYYVNSYVNVYNTNDNNQPRIWTHKWSIPVKTTGMYNVMSSVFSDSDSLAQFSAAARNMGRVSVLASPKKVYMESSLETDTRLAGEILNSNSDPQQNNRLNQPASQVNGNLSEQRRQQQRELQRLLKSSR